MRLHGADQLRCARHDAGCRQRAGKGAFLQSLQGGDPFDQTPWPASDTGTTIDWPSREASTGAASNASRVSPASAYCTTVRPMHEQFVEPTRAHADVLADGAGELDGEAERVLTAFRSVGRGGAGKD